MELMAVIKGLQALTKRNIPLTIFTDSKYIVDTVEKRWLDKWVKTNFAGGKKNKDLWMEYYNLSKDFKIRFHWVKGHADNAFNNRCDELATTAADSRELLVDEGYELSSETNLGL